MNSLKRPAEALLPSPHAAKQHRTNMVGRDRASPSVAEQPRLLLRWKDFYKQFGALTSDTIKAIYSSRRALMND